MEKERKISWLSLFIKIVIIFVFLIIVIWLLSRIVGKAKLSETFINNINSMEQTSIEYFKTIELPLDKNQSITITLEELLEKKLISSENKYLVNNCDTKESYSKITRNLNEYIVNTTLKCGNETDVIEELFSLKDCKNCNQHNSNVNSEENTPNKVTYYEHVKETTEYTKWMRGSITGTNVENRYEYYGITYQTYYTLGIIPTNKKTITYTLKLDKVPNNKYYFTTIDQSSTYNNEDEPRYLKEDSVSMYDGNKYNASLTNISDYSLKQSNITYRLSPYYRDGAFYVRVTVDIESTEGISTYYDISLQENVYIIPLKIHVKFASSDIKDTKPIGEYETISYYRYITTNKETIWSAQSFLEGYKYTGKTKVQ